MNNLNYFKSIPGLALAGRLGRWLLALCICIGFGQALQLSAQTNTAQTNVVKQPAFSKRYLFVLETSRSMQRRADGTLQAIQFLLSGGIGGQLRRGDTIGIWTYDSELHAGTFPLQQWTPETHRAACLRIANFVKEQKYQNQANFGKVVAAVDSVVQNSDLITIILVSDGSQEIKGTPFDDRINENFKMWKAEQQTAHMPLITLLRAVGGKLTQFTVNPAQWPVEVPALPVEYQKIETAQAPTNAPKAKPTPPIGQSVIISGKKPQPVEQPKSPQVQPNVTGQPPARLADDITKAPQTPAQPAPVTPKSEVAPLKIEQPATELPGTQPPQTATPKASAPVVVNALPKTDDAKPLPAPVVPNSDAIRPLSENLANTAPAAPREVDAKQTAPVASAGSPTPNLQTGQPAKEVAANHQSSQVARSAEAVIPRPAGSLFPGILIWVAVGIIVLLLVGGFVVLRRSRPVSQASLITRSIDRREKE